MTKQIEEPPTPSDKLLISSATTPAEETTNEKVKLKKGLGLLEGVAIILGIICGSGKRLSIILRCKNENYLKKFVAYFENPSCDFNIYFGSMRLTCLTNNPIMLFFSFDGVLA